MLTDTNIHSDVVAFLRHEQIDVVDVKEAGWGSESDAEIFRRAAAMDRVIITHDADFAPLAIGQTDSCPGIIYLRPGHLPPQPTIDSLSELLLQNPVLSSPFPIVLSRKPSGLKIRIVHL